MFRHTRVIVIGVSNGINITVWRSAVNLDKLQAQSASDLST